MKYRFSLPYVHHPAPAMGHPYLKEKADTSAQSKPWVNLGAVSCIRCALSISRFQVLSAIGASFTETRLLTSDYLGSATFLCGILWQPDSSMWLYAFLLINAEQH